MSSKKSDFDFCLSIRHQVKIKDLTPAERTSCIMQIIAIQAALTGFKGKILGAHKTDIAILLVNRFSLLSLEEINRAFQMDRQGYYDAPTKHFQLFNAEYVGEIMNKYVVWKQEMNRNPYFERKLRKQANTLAKIERAEKAQKLRIQIKAGLIYRFDQYKNEKIRPENINATVRHLISLGLIPNSDDLSMNRKQEVRKRASENLKECFSKNDLTDKEKKVIHLEECWMIIVSEFFDSLINKNQHISTLLKHIPDEE